MNNEYTILYYFDTGYDADDEYDESYSIYDDGYDGDDEYGF